MDVTKPAQLDGEMVKMRRFLHAWMSVSSVASLLYGSIRLFISMFNEKYYKIDILIHGYEYSPYFLTLWISGAHILYYHMYSAIDIIEVYYNNNKKLLELTEYIHKAASYFLFTIIFPMSVYVVFAFWGAYLWDQEKMYPSVIYEFLPSWINHCMHTLPLPAALLYMFTSNRHEPSKLAAVTGIMVFLSIYWGLFLSLKVVKGKWVYPVMESFPPSFIPIFIGISLTTPILFLLLGYKVNNIFQGVKSNIAMILTA